MIKFKDLGNGSLQLGSEIFPAGHLKAIFYKDETYVKIYTRFNIFYDGPVTDLA